MLQSGLRWKQFSTAQHNQLLKSQATPTCSSIPFPSFAFRCSSLSLFPPRYFGSPLEQHTTHWTRTIRCTCRSPTKILMSVDCPDFHFIVFSLDSRVGKLSFCQRCQFLHFCDLRQIRQSSSCSPLICENKQTTTKKAKHKYKIVISPYAFLCCWINLHKFRDLQTESVTELQSIMTCERNHSNTNSDGWTLPSVQRDPISVEVFLSLIEIHNLWQAGCSSHQCF